MIFRFKEFERITSQIAKKNNINKILITKKFSLKEPLVLMNIQFIFVISEEFGRNQMFRKQYNILQLQSAVSENKFCQ
jgi:hypothetical protein